MNHFDCGPWVRHAPCVYCACGVRLYNGTLPQNDTEKRQIADFLADIPGWLEQCKAPCAVCHPQPTP